MVGYGDSQRCGWKLAFIATLVSIWLRMGTAPSETSVGAIAQVLIGVVIGAAALGADRSWIKLRSGTGAIVRTSVALFGLSHTRSAAVHRSGSCGDRKCLVPTLIANALSMPRHALREPHEVKALPRPGAAPSAKAK